MTRTHPQGVVERKSKSRTRHRINSTTLQSPAPNPGASDPMEIRGQCARMRVCQNLYACATLDEWSRQVVRVPQNLYRDPRRPPLRAELLRASPPARTRVTSLRQRQVRTLHAVTPEHIPARGSYR